MIEYISDHNYIDFYYDTYRTWIINIENISDKYSEHFASVVHLISSNETISLINTSKHFLVKFINCKYEISYDYNYLFQCYKPLGNILVAYLDCESRFDEDINIMKERLNKLKLDPNLFNSLLLIFSAIPLPHKIELSSDICVINIKTMNEHEHTDTDTDVRANIIERINIFLDNIYFSLEKKAMQIKFAKLSHSHKLLKVSVECDFENDMDSKVLSKLMYTRHRKILGDIYILMGYYSRAISAYLSCIDTFSMLSDNLWLASIMLSIGLAALYADDEINSDYVISNSIFKIRSTLLTVKLTEIEDMELHNKATEIINRKMTIKYWIDAFSFFKQYFVIEPMYTEYHFVGVFMYYCITNTIPKEDLVQVNNVLSSRILDFRQINYRIPLLLLMTRLLHKIGWYRRKTFYLHEFAQLVIKNQCKTYYTRATNALLYILKIHNKCFNTLINIDTGWTESYFMILLDLITLYKARQQQNEALRIAFYLFSHLKTEVDDISKQIIMTNISKDAPDQLIEPLEHIPYTKEISLKPINNHNIISMSHFNKASSGPFIHEAFRQEIVEGDIYMCMSETFSVILALENPLPLKISSTLQLIVDKPDMCKCDSTFIDIEPLKVVKNVSLCFKPTTIGSFLITGYSAISFGMKSNYIMKKPWSIQCVNIAPVPIINFEKVENTLSQVEKALLNQKIYTLNTYEGSILKGNINISPPSETMMKNIYFKYKRTEFLYQQKLPKFICDTNENSVNLAIQIGNEGGMNPLMKGTFFIEIGVYAYTDSYLYCLEQSIKLQVNVIPLLTITDFSLSTIKNHPSCSLCSFMCLNESKDDLYLSVNLKDNCCEVINNFLIRNSSTTKIDFHFSKIPFIEISQYRSEWLSKFIVQLVVDRLNIKWKINLLDNSIMTGICILRFILPLESTPHLLQIPYCHLKISLLDYEYVENNIQDFEVGKTYLIKLEIKNPLKYGLKNLRVSLLSPNIVKGHTNALLWTGTLCKYIKRLESNQSVIVSFNLLFAHEGEYTADMIVQMVESNSIVDEINKYISWVDHNSSAHNPDILFSLTSNLGNTYLSCLACKSLTIKAVDTCI